MVLGPETKLGPYEIISLIGAGGMGEVYKAKDTRLDRTVAIKVLPSHLAENPERRERFEREARAVSSLNHPHICTLHDVGEQDGTHYLVMEYIEGDTLADRLKKGPLPLGQALQYGIQIADALDKAHRQGVVHRDLKPGNVMLSKPGAKLLDFGLAKLKSSEAGKVGSDLSALPTEQKPLTKEGSILGTFQYMAPEQLEGKEADARTDIFAFGSVLYEMVTGKRAFEGKSQASLIGAIMNSEPPALQSLQPMIPRVLDNVIKTCLNKEPDERWQSAADVGKQLKWITDGESTESPAAFRRSIWRKAIPHVATTIIAGFVVAITFWSLSDVPQYHVTRFFMDLAPTEGLRTRADPNIAISPDGSHIVYVGVRAGVRQLYVRPLDQLHATPLANTAGAYTPFFSPDGEWVGFFSDAQGEVLSKVPLAGGTPRTIYEDQTGIGFRGASWGTDDMIVFASRESGIARISANGGNPEVLAAPDADKDELYYEFPEILPGGRGIVFTIRTGQRLTDTRIAVLRPDNGEQEIIVEGGTGARYVPTGHLVYGQAGRLMAMPFDLAQLKETGSPVQILDNLITSYTLDGPGHFSVSLDGTLIYVPELPRKKRMVWMDRAGRVESLPLPEAEYGGPHLSPDGRRLAMNIIDENGASDIWVYDIEREALTKLTFSGDNIFAVWTPDAQRITFSSGSPWNLFWVPADGSAEPDRLSTDDHRQVPTSWSPDGRVLAYQQGTTGNMDVYVLRLQHEDTPNVFLSTPFMEREARFSPDGRWIAYRSNESGRDEVYVRSFPDGGAKLQISTNGGAQPMWAPQGGELFYKEGDRLMVVDFQLDPVFSASKPRLLFESKFPERVPGDPARFAVAPDAQRFLNIVPGDDASLTQDRIYVVLNWFEELKRLAPTDN